MSLSHEKQDRYLVISADAHAGGDVGDYREYLPKRWHSEFDDWSRNAQSRWDVRNEGRENSRNWDSDRRVKENEADGISAELIFPNTLPPFYPRHALGANLPEGRAEYERQFAGLQASNRWVVDFCAEAVGRRKGLVQILLNDIDDALAEIRWGKDAGLAAILIPGVRPGHPLEGLWSPRYDPIWALAEELDMPVNQHVGAGKPELGPNPVELLPWTFEAPFYSQRTMWHLVLGAVFERFPRLKFIMTEDGLDWVGPVMTRLDETYNVLNDDRVVHSRLFGEAAGALSLRPSRYIQRNCYICASGAVHPDEIRTRQKLGSDHLLWGSDYPHDEGSFPFSRAALRAFFADVSPDECRRILGLTAAGLYGFDVDLLKPIADRVGPTVAEVHTPLESYPEGSHLELFLGPLTVPQDTLAGAQGANSR